MTDSISGINHDLKEASRLATIEIFALDQNVQGCIQSSIISVRKEVEDVVAVVSDCAAQKGK